MHRMLLAALLTATPLTAQVQTPASAPALSLPIELVSARPTAAGATWYQRRGLTPREFRVGTTSQMTGASWQALRESGAVTKTVSGASVVEATVSHPAMGMGKSCGGVNKVWVKTYLQLRAVDPTKGTTHVSNIRGDSVCAALGG